MIFFIKEFDGLTSKSYLKEVSLVPTTPAINYNNGFSFLRNILPMTKT